MRDPAAALPFLVLLVCLTFQGPARSSRAEEPGLVPEQGGGVEVPDSTGEPLFVEGATLQGTSRGGTQVTRPMVRHGSLTVTADEAWLSQDRDLLTFHGNVHIQDSARVATADQGVYRRSTRVLTLSGNVKGHGREGTFSAGDLTWERLRQHLTLRDRPVITEPDRVVHADRFEYDSPRQEGEAFGEVRVLMLPDSTWAFGRHAVTEAEGRTVLTGEPWLQNPGAPGEEKSEVRADTLLLDSTKNTGEARSNVRIVRGALRAKSGRALSRTQDNTLILSEAPVAWDPDGEIRADTMTVRVRHREADQLRAYGHVLVHYSPAEKLGEQNLILGDTLVAGLRAGAVTDMQMQGDGVSLYLPALRDAQTGTGRNVCRARNIHVFLSRAGAERVDLVRSASGTYLYPSDANRRRLANPAEIDSLLPAGLRREKALPGTRRGDAGAGGADPRPAPARPDTLARRSARLRPDSLLRPTPPEPPPLPPSLEAFVRSRTLELPESLQTPYDRLFDQRVDYEGDTIRFYPPEDRIRILGHGKLKYQGNELASHEINYRADKNLVTSLGEPELSDPQNKVRGVKMTYRTDEREGIIYQGRTAFENGFYYGEEIKKTPGDVLLVRQGDYTTCDKDTVTDYHFHAWRMKMIMKDKVVARPVVLYIRNVPVFALPYYVFPIKKGRASGIMLPDVELGLNRNQGRFARNLGYYWAVNDYMDLRSWIDYYDAGPRIYVNEIYRYAVRYMLQGSEQGSYLREKSSTGRGSVRWSLQANHSQTLGENAQLTANLDFTSDKNYRNEQNFGAGVNQRLNRILRSTVGATKRWSRLGLSMTANRTEYLDQTTANGVKVDQQLPSVDLTVNSGTIGRAPDATGRGARLPFLSTVYFGTSGSYRNIYVKRYDGTSTKNMAAQESWSLSDNRSLGSLLRIRPGLSGNFAVFEKDALGRRWRGGGTWGGSIAAGNTLYGTSLFSLGPLASVRHVIEPSVSYNYRPEFRSLTYGDSAGVRRALFPGVGGISLSGSKASSMSLSLGQRFHAKLGKGDKVVKQENILTWNTSTSYNFLAKQLPGSARARRLSAISNTFSLRPFSLIESTAGVTHDPYRRVPLNFNVNTQLRLDGRILTRMMGDTTGTGVTPEYGEFGASELRGADVGQSRNPTQAATGQPWSMSLNHAYSHQYGSGSPTNTMNLRLDLSPTMRWRFGASAYFDLHRHEVISHSLSMARDLHCWEMRFEHRQSGSNSEYYFRIAIKQLPDLQYQKEQR